jgi:hypothetical protein
MGRRCFSSPPPSAVSCRAPPRRRLRDAGSSSLLRARPPPAASFLAPPPVTRSSWLPPAEGGRMVDGGAVGSCSAVTSATTSDPAPALSVVAALAGVASGLPAAVHDLAACGGSPACPSAPLHQPPPAPTSLPPSPFKPTIFSSADRLLLCCFRSPQDLADVSPVLLPELSSASPRAPPAAAAGLGEERGWQHVGSGRRSSRAFSPPFSKVEALERCLAFKRWARGRCFRCLERGH